MIQYNNIPLYSFDELYLKREVMFVNIGVYMCLIKSNICNQWYLDWTQYDSQTLFSASALGTNWNLYINNHAS